MNPSLLFIRHWLPSIGVLTAAGWVLFRWIFEQRLRSLKEMPALSGELTILWTQISKGTGLASIRSNWQSNSPLPIYIDPQKSVIDNFDLPIDIEPGAVRFADDLGESRFRSFPLRGAFGFVMEPHTNSQIVMHFALETGKLYCVRLIIYGGSKRQSNQPFAWIREAILDTRN